MRRTTLSVLALAATGLSAPAFAQDSGSDGSEAAATEVLGTSYCNTGFYPFDTDDDAMLSEEEIRTGSSAVFEEIDADDDGAITRDEFANCEERGLEAAQEVFSRTYGDVEAAELDEAWASAAENNPQIDEDGMSRAEFLAAAVNTGEVLPTMTLEAEGAEPVAFGGPFIYFGQDENRAELTAEEIAVRSAFTFELTDTDGDDTLTREEFIERGEELTVDIERINDRFDAMDADGNESLTPEEFSGMDRLRTDDAVDLSEGIPVISYFFFQRG